MTTACKGALRCVPMVYFCAYNLNTDFHSLGENIRASGQSHLVFITVQGSKKPASWAGIGRLGDEKTKKSPNPLIPAKNPSLNVTFDRDYQIT